MKNIAPRLIKLRNDLNLTQREVGLLSGVSHTALCMIEKGKRNPNISTLIKLANAYNVGLDFIVRGRGLEAYHCVTCSKIRNLFKKEINQHREIL